MKYRKKPIVVEAEQWFPDKNVPGVFAGHNAGFGPYVITIHNQPTGIDPGDWVILESNGIHYYTCKDEIFKMFYEPAE